MSTRNSDDHYLDAARALVLEVGVRRSSFADVARRAGVSRTTLYRHYSDFGSILTALMTREFGALIAEVRARAAGWSTAREQLVEATATGIDLLGRNPLFSRVIELDPDVLLPYVTERPGDTQKMAMAAFESYIDAGRTDGSIRSGDASLIAYCLQVAMQGFALSTRVSDEHDRAAVVSEIKILIDAYLSPR